MPVISLVILVSGVMVVLTGGYVVCVQNTEQHKRV